MHYFIQSHKQAWPDAKALAQAGDLAHVQLPVACQHLGNHALVAHLGQLRLAQAMLLHQKAQGLRGRGIGHGVRALVMGLQQIGQQCKQVFLRAAFSGLAAIGQCVHQRQQALIVVQPGGLVKGHEGLVDLVHVQGIHGSYSLSVKSSQARLPIPPQGQAPGRLRPPCPSASTSCRAWVWALMPCSCSHSASAFGRGVTTVRRACGC